MKYVTLTGTVAHYLLSDPDMPETVKEWMLTEADAKQRMVSFANRLAEDFQEFRVPGEAVEAQLQNKLIGLALERVDWFAVARRLLKHFTLPVILASRPAAPDWQNQSRLREPVEWVGPVN